MLYCFAMRRCPIPFKLYQMLRTAVFVFLAFVTSLSASVAQPMVAHKHMIIYKTRAELYDHVPVLLAPDKKSVVSFPDPMDIRAASTRLLPIQLHDGYLLSAAGVNEHTAFLKLTYRQYADLQSAPSPQQLHEMVEEKNPFQALCDCGVAKNPEQIPQELNELIDKKLVKKRCRKMHAKN